MLLHLTDLSEQPLYRQLSTQITEKILRGDLPRGTVLPPTGTMARTHHVSVNTVRRAYQELKKKNLIEGQAGEEAVVSSLSPEQKQTLEVQKLLTRHPPLSALEIIAKQFTTISDIEDLKERMEEALKKSLLVKSIHFVMHENSATEYRLRPSKESHEPFITGENDPVFQLIHQTEEPLEIESVPIPLHESDLLRNLMEREVKIVVPLNEGNQCLGFIALSEKVTGEIYSKEDIGFISILARHFMLAYARACFSTDLMEKRRMDDELLIARQIQADLVPETLPVNGRFTMAAQCAPARLVGGDMYDYIPIDENRCALVIADACGNGLPAALLIAQTQAMLRSELNNGNTVQQALENMNRHIVRFTPQDKFVTLFYSEYNKRSGVLQYANAGHNYPVLMRKNGRYERLQTGGLALGMFSEAKYETGHIELEDGDVLFLFTDGLTEAMDDTGQEYGEQRLLDVLYRYHHLSAGGILDEVLADVCEYCGMNSQHDDLTILVLKIGHTPDM